MNRLSVAMIVKNEEKNLHRCLGSIQGLWHQLVVVDTGSSDRSKEIARSFGAEVYDFKWCDDFSSARNFSIDKCRHEWIMVIDADEALDNDAAPLILDAIENSNPCVFNILLRNHYKDGNSVTLDVAPKAEADWLLLQDGFTHYTDTKIPRIIYRLDNDMFTGRIHESWGVYVGRHSLPSADLNVVIHHFGKVDLAREEAKKDYYLELAKLDVADRPSSTVGLFNLISQAYIAEQWNTVVQAADKYIAICHEAPIPVALMAAMARQKLGLHEEAISYLEAILKPFPDNVLALNRIAISLFSVGKIDEAQYHIRKAIELNPDFENSKMVLAKVESYVKTRQ